MERSFERISVDGQLSTNDSVFAIASGASGVAVEPGSDDERAFAAALDALLRQLAVEIVADGEGAERVARLVVRGAVEAVEPVARAVANSPLVKCALHGGDPNWGRILAGGRPGGAGRRPVAARPLHRGRPGRERRRRRGRSTRTARRRLDEAMAAAEVELRLDLARRAARRPRSSSATSGHEYVRFNSEYST